MRLTHDAGDVHSPGRLSHVVVGVDFAGPSLAVGQWVGRYLAQAAQLTLVHVTPVASAPNVARRWARDVSTDARPTGERLRSLRGALRGLASVSGARRTAVAVRVGDPATQLAAYADLVRADLIVIAGSSAYHIVPDDGIPERLLRHTRRPVLIARGLSGAPRTVLATVGSVDASPVVAAARMVALPAAAQVRCFRTPVRSAIESDVYRRLERVTAEANGAREILDAAVRLRADIIAVGAPGPDRNAESGQGRAELVRTLVRTASCSVLVVRDAAMDPPPSHPRLETHWPRRNPRPDGRDVTRGSDGPTRPAAECLETAGAA